MLVCKQWQQCFLFLFQANSWYSLVLGENFLQVLLSGVDGDGVPTLKQRRSIPAWRYKMSTFLKKTPAPDTEELVHLAHLSKAIPDEEVQQAGRQMSQRWESTERFYRVIYRVFVLLQKFLTQICTFDIGYIISQTFSLCVRCVVNLETSGNTVNHIIGWVPCMYPESHSYSCIFIWMNSHANNRSVVDGWILTFCKLFCLNTVIEGCSVKTMNVFLYVKKSQWLQTKSVVGWAANIFTFFLPN